jgi:signal transduction histidine kinase
VIPLLQVIHIEDSPADSELMQRMLEGEGFGCQVRRVESREQLLDALQQVSPDLVISDCTLPHFSGIEALEIVRAANPDVPFIFLSGTIGEETAVDSLQHGATDYVLKQRTARLVPAVRRALEDARARRGRAALEAQLRQARKLEAIGASVGGIAHDFRNLLQVLKSGIEVLVMKPEDPAAVLAIAKRLNTAADRGCQMVEELMAFSRKTDTHLVRTDTARLIKETAQGLQASLPPAITLELHPAENVPPVLVDPTQFDRILTNLVVNARDAMPQGGRIVISSDVVHFGSLPPDSWKIRNAPYFRVIVSDTGMGMDEATQARIFEPFFTTKSAGKGTGLGLSVVYGLMEAHQGFIDLDSSPGRGTTFSLFFPLPEGIQVVDRVHLVAPKRLVGELVDTDKAGDYSV